MANSLVIIGAFLYGALYLAAVFVAAMVWGNHPTALIVIVAMGVSFLSYIAMHIWPVAMITRIATLLSWALAIAAGLLLLF
jgi:hypothetical protein